MAQLPVATKLPADALFARLAREIAVDHRELEDILKQYTITPEEWTKIQANPQFAKILESEILAWQSATNTAERTKLKTAALIEEWLPTANAELHDRAQGLPGRVELAKLLAKIAGMGERSDAVASGEKFSITINLGADNKLKFDKEVTPKVIDAEVITEPSNGAT